MTVACCTVQVCRIYIHNFVPVHVSQLNLCKYSYSNLNFQFKNMYILLMVDISVVTYYQILLLYELHITVHRLRVQVYTEVFYFLFCTLPGTCTCMYVYCIHVVCTVPGYWCNFNSIGLKLF